LKGIGTELRIDHAFCHIRALESHPKRSDEISGQIG